MALKNFTEQDNELPFILSFSQYCKIAEHMQKQKAKRQETRKERANTTLTTKQKLIGWTQLGGIVKYKAISYTTYEGQGVLMINDKPYMIFATFSDFINLCKKVYGVKNTIRLQVAKP